MTFKANTLILLLLLSCVGTNAQYFRNYTDEDGLAGNNAYYVFQDSRNYLWISTETGVSRFDGFSFQNFYQSNGLSDNEIFKINEDSLGRIWFNASNGIPCYYKDGKLVDLEFSDTVQSNKSAFISYVLQHDDKVYIASFGNGLFVYADGKLKKLKADLPSQHISYLIAWGERIYIFTSAGICSLFEGEIQRVRSYEFKEDQHFLRCTKVGRNVIFKAKDGFYQFDCLKRELKPVYSPELAELNVIHFSVHGKDIWAGTRNGAYKVHLKSDSLFVNDGFLKGYSVSSICSDHENNMWFSTLTNGVFMKPFSKISRVKGIAEEVYSLAFHENSLYAGANRNKLFVIGNGEVEASHTIEKRPNENKKITSLQFTEDSLWLGMEGLTALATASDTLSFRLFGRCRLVRDNYMYFANQLGLYKFPISLALQPSVNDSLWYERIDISKYQLFKASCYNITEGKAGELLISTDRGLFIYYDNSVREKETLNRLSKHRTVDACPVSSGLAMATFGSGVIIEQGSKKIKMDHNSGLSSDFCRFVKEISSDQLIVGTENGINLITFTADSFQISTFNHLNGLSSNKCNDAIIRNDTLWVATLNGIDYLPLSAFDDNMVSVPLRLEDILINGERTDIETLKDLSFRQNSISLEFAAISFKNSDKIRLNYKLGKEIVWTTTSERLIELKSLEPNNYQLFVQACLPNGTCSETIAIPFTIHPPFWRTNWFRLSIILGAGAIIYLFFRIRVLTYNRDVVREILDLIVAKLKKEKTIVFKDVKDGSSAQLVLNDITFLESSRNYITIYRQDKPKVVTRITLKEAEELLDNEAHDQFLRIHKSYIINKKRIEAVHPTFVKIGEEKVSIGRTYQETLKDFIESYQAN